MATLAQIEKQLALEPIKGFLANDEAQMLYQLALTCSKKGVCMEIGSYCGLSTIYIAGACRENNSVVFSIDHHSGSEEHQLGELYHDPSLYDPKAQCVSTLGEFQANINRFDLAASVIPIVASSEVVSRVWQQSLAFLFIDGGHGVDTTMHDFLAWPQHLSIGGMLAVHDIFEHEADGGQAPYNALQSLLQLGQFEYVERVNSMEVYRRIK